MLKTDIATDLIDMQLSLLRTDVGFAWRVKLDQSVQADWHAHVACKVKKAMPLALLKGVGGAGRHIRKVFAPCPCRDAEWEVYGELFDVVFDWAAGDWNGVTALEVD